MSDQRRTYRTKTGRVLTDNDIEAFAAEAERGYEIEHLAKRPGRPWIGSAPALLVPVRLHADLHSAVKALAEAERTSLSELVRDAVRQYLATPTAPAVLRTPTGRVLTGADVDALADEAYGGYDVSSVRPSRRIRGRAKVVPVRMPPELKAEVEQRAEAESTSVSEIVRAALRARLNSGDSDPPRPGGSPGRAIARGVRPTEADTCRDYVLPRLQDSGWTPDQIIEQYPVTDGRIVATARGHRRDRPLRADYLLEVEPGTAVALVEAKREYRLPTDGLQQAKRYAQRLDLPLAYSTNGRGIVEHDFDTGTETTRATFPSPDEAWQRFRGWKGIVDDASAEILRFPFSRALRNPDGTVKEPRSYQRAAIQRALESITSRDKRILLTMATGTGKTFVAMQIVWKLWSQRWLGERRPRILYLADRNILVDQPIQREFQPVFGDAVWKVRGGVRTGREIYFALYQALARSGGTLGIFRDYPEDYFDLVIVDECHRGSARDESSWREILEHFAPATQLGMTATPLRDDNVNTYRYFGNPVYQYSLAQGIDDGFLAPYRVRRIVLSPDAYGWAPEEGQLDRFGREVPPGVYETPHFERVVSLLSRTELAARHLTDFLKRTDRMAKTIVFCVDAEHADQMRAALHRANGDLTRQYPNYVARIVSAEHFAAEHLGEFADVERDEPVIATTAKLLSTGVDLPTVRNIVLFKPIGSIVEFKQIIGRGTRLYPDADKLSFEIIDFSGATALFEDPEFDGPPEQIVEEEVDDKGQVIEVTEVAEAEPVFGHDVADIEDVEEAGVRKLYVDDAEVYVAAEGFYLPDPGGGRLRLVEYREYVGDQVRRLFTRPDDLRSRWRTASGRDEVVELLHTRGVAFEEIAERTGLPEADPFDLLVHIAWNAPVTTRRQRAQRLRREHAGFLDTFAPEAREILDELLEKYASHGITQLDDLRVLEVEPFPRYGTVVEIAGRFGGPEPLREAVKELQELLYAA
jgi:type I restriction enzyme, R subunit